MPRAVLLGIVRALIICWWQSSFGICCFGFFLFVVSVFLFFVSVFLLFVVSVFLFCCFGFLFVIFFLLFAVCCILHWSLKRRSYNWFALYWVLPVISSSPFPCAKINFQLVFQHINDVIVLVETKIIGWNITLVH